MERDGRRRIDDYGFLSDCHTAALVDRRGSIDWWCPSRFDAPSVFGRLLDAGAGHWSLHPSAEFKSTRRYVGATLVVRTTFVTAAGEVEVTDALALEPRARGHEIGRRAPHTLVRRVEGRRGAVAMTTELVPRMEYGLTSPHLTDGADVLLARGGPTTLSLRSDVALTRHHATAGATFTVAAGDTVEFQLGYSPSFSGEAPPPQIETPTIDDTLAGWESWSALHQGYRGRHRNEVLRSALVLQGLTYKPSGAVVAAATTSLPEKIGGELNFDYRFAWLRDLSLTIRSLWIAACPDEASELFRWIAEAAGQLGDERVQVMYGVAGERDLTEHTVDHLCGFRDSRPVRVGNDAWDQSQLDVLGEVLDAAHQLRDQLGELSELTQALLVALANRAATTWREADAGMWEARDQQRQYVSSKVLCWVALDRAIILAPALGAKADPARWRRARQRVRDAVLSKAWSETAGAYAGAFDSDELDASVLLLPLVGFLAADDPRMWATIEAIERELGDVGLVRRWPEDPMGFLICTYWLSECLALGGELERAEAWFERATSYANDLGLLAEEADPDRMELLGNFPQAFSHVGLINAAWRLTQVTRAPSSPDDE
ncbi:MAG: glycoside hydrolase family 15 protein [Acidimicrobiia bacterium]|nr:glycoside hydrolase family 15 protein [Acidimicrobiia bacterium]